MKPLTYLINCAPEGAEAEWHQAGEEFKDSEDVVAVIAYSEYQAQAKRIAELEQEKYVRDLVVISLNQVVDMRVDSLEQYLHATALNKKFIAEIESLRKQVEMLLGSARKTVLALAHASIHDPLYTAAYDELSESIKSASKNGE